jgi:hypothetical protein
VSQRASVRSTPSAYRRKDLSFLYSAGDSVSLACYTTGGLCRVPSSAALRAARGAGEERPEPGGENNCRLAAESAAILGLARDRVSVQRAVSTGHVAAIFEYNCWLPAATRWSSKAPTIRHSPAHGCGRSDQDSNISSRPQTVSHDLTGLPDGLDGPARSPWTTTPRYNVPATVNASRRS